MVEGGEEDRLIGTLVGERYRVQRKLGEGGMGLVYLAVHEALHKQVALKVLSTSGKVEPETIARFEREAITTANLKHPNIAEATDFGQLPGGGLYLVMEYVEGTTLRRLLSEAGRLTPERALTILQQVGAALATAHARDVVHRDLKPENVIVSTVPAVGPSPSAEVVKVIDFGIAKLKSATFGVGGKTNITREGTVFGTPEYMSPEQVMGQPVDARADQYALGVLAFELLTGKPPYKSEDVAQLVMMHVGAPIPSTRDLAPGLPVDVDAVTSKMLAKLPDERFDSVASAMHAFATALTVPMAAIDPGTVPLPAPAIVERTPTIVNPTPTVVERTPTVANPTPTIANPAPTKFEYPAQTLNTTLASPGNALGSRKRRAIVIASGGALALAGLVALLLFARSCSSEAEVTEATMASAAASAQPSATPPAASSAPPPEGALPPLVSASPTATSAVKPASVAAKAPGVAPVVAPKPPAAPTAPTILLDRKFSKGKGKDGKEAKEGRGGRKDD